MKNYYYNSKEEALGKIILKAKLYDTKILVLNHMLENIEMEDHFIGTQRKVAKNLGISLKTVASTFKILQEENIIEQVQNGVYKFKKIN